DWINEQTHGLLKDGVDKLKFSPDMLMAIVSTIYFKAKWSMDFSQFEEDRFQTVNGDVEATFMKKTFNGPFYRGDIFSAVPYHFTQNTGCMWLILPNENTEMNTVLCSAEYQEFMKDPGSKCSMYEISLSLPKFDISCDSDLIPVLESLGITDVFLPGVADFSPSIITERDDYPPYVTKIQHNARVRIDEKGCEGTAYTVIEVDFGTSIKPPEYEKIVFELDRPFLFVVTSQHNMPLFSGVVNDPTAS
ncbi:MAG: hypothetical protein IJF33_07785, partial [Clostridia bacterium]|nr:hypothetical protein [Clostridia bacterium]